MLSDILSYMQCPRCSGQSLLAKPDCAYCSGCQSLFPLTDGILDMIGEDGVEVITPFQRLMQAPAITMIYEGFWRQLGYFLASSRSFSKELELVMSHGNRREDGPALDLACGPGVFTRPLARQERGIIIGVDLSRPMLRQAERRIQAERIQNIGLMRASAFLLPFSDATFSYVNCCGALHLFDRPDKALQEIRRVLKPGGLFCVQTTIRPVHSAGFARFLEKFIRFGFFDEAELRHQLQVSGFAIQQSERHRISFTFLAV